MASKTLFRPYTSQLSPNDRKRTMLDATFDWMDRAYSASFDLFVRLYAGVQYSTVDVFTQDTIHDADLLCAINWFRLFNIEPQAVHTTNISSEEMMQRFTAYSGHAPSLLAESYLTGNFDPERHIWVDCRELFNQFARSIGVTPTELMVDVDSMISHKIIPIVPEVELNAYNALSNLFATGQKENKAEKVAWYSAIAEKLESSRPSTWEDYRAIITEVTDCRTSADMNRKAKGSPNILSLDLGNGESGQMSSDFLVKRIKDCKDNAKGKAAPYDLPNRLKIREWVAAQIGPFQHKIWTPAFQVSCGDIKSKNSNNIKYSNEKLQRSLQIAQLKSDFPDIGMAQKILNEFRRGEDNEFSIEKRHLSGLKNLYKLWASKGMDEGIEEYQMTHDDDYGRAIIVDLARYLYSHRSNFNAEQFLAAAELNKLERLHERKKVHPTVFGQTVISWGESSTIEGTVTPPDMIVRGRIEHAGSSGMIWVTMTLLDNGRWVKHHLPFHNSRYYEEVYAYREGLPTRDEPRLPIFGTAIRGPISDSDQINRQCTKASKAFLRTKNNMAYNVAFDPATQFRVSRKDGQYTVTISSRVKPRKSVRNMSIGHRIMGIDQNQTAPNTYSVWEIVADGTPDSFKFNGKSLKLVEDGHIKSVCLGGPNKEEIDQLNYSGGQPEWWKAWQRERVAFVNNIADKTVTERVKRWSEWAGKYQWVSMYAKLLKKMLKSAASSGVQIESVFRAEIEALVTTSIRSGSLSHHSLQMLTDLKSVISSYFSLHGKKEVEDQRSFDPDLFSLRDIIDKKRVCKRKQKVDRVVSSILQIANRLNVQMIAVEGELSTATKDVKSKVNQRAMDWCSRRVVKKMDELCKQVGINCWKIDQRDTSHLDPFVWTGAKHDNGELVGKECRYDVVSPSEIREFHCKKFLKWFRILKKEIIPNSTNDYLYVQAFQDFANHYGLQVDDLPKIKFFDLAKLVKDHKEIIIPCRGGRHYLSSHPVTIGCRKVNYCGRERWLNNSDVVAACNIVLRACNKKENKTG